MKGVSGVFRSAISAIGRDQIRDPKGGAVSPIKADCLLGLGLPGFNIIFHLFKRKWTANAAKYRCIFLYYSGKQ